MLCFLALITSFAVEAFVVRFGLLPKLIGIAAGCAGAHVLSPHLQPVDAFGFGDSLLRSLIFLAIALVFSDPIMSSIFICLRNLVISECVTFLSMGRLPFEPMMRMSLSTPFSSRASSVFPAWCPAVSLPASIRKLMAGLETMFFTILSIPIFSVSVLPTMQSPSGFSFTSFSSSFTLARVETPTGAELFTTVYSPSTGGHESLFTVISHVERVAEVRTGYLAVSHVIASGGMQYLHPRHGYSSGVNCPYHSLTLSSSSFASLIFNNGSEALRFSSVPFMQPHFLHLVRFMPL
ncbi:hypothetical protein BMS3Bbin09_00904 [bacterium BMS3Bbin09]|nr:hypothetical protein BMS3Bbin09_00904 [bacterium BMS3Bbin09]